MLRELPRTIVQFAILLAVVWSIYANVGPELQHDLRWWAAGVAVLVTAIMVYISGSILGLLPVTLLLATMAWFLGEPSYQGLLVVWGLCLATYGAFVAFWLCQWMLPFIAKMIAWPFVAPARLWRRWRAYRAAKALARRRRLEPVAVIVPARAGNVSADEIIQRLGLKAE